MSLINDALKRAKQHQPPPAPASTGDIGSPMRPVEPPHRPRSGASTLIVGLIAIVLLLAGAMFYLAGRSSAGPPTPALSLPSANPTNTLTPIAAAPIPDNHAAVSSPVEQSVVTNIAIPGPKPPETVVTSAPPAPTIVTQVVVVATPVAPSVALKLQGIFYRPSRPSAMINGKTVLIGEQIGDARVLGISQTTVTFLQDGQTNVLSLE